jgi:hypothetical protein
VKVRDAVEILRSMDQDADITIDILRHDFPDTIPVLGIEVHGVGTHSEAVIIPMPQASKPE